MDNNSETTILKVYSSGLYILQRGNTSTNGTVQVGENCEFKLRINREYDRFELLNVKTHKLIYKSFDTIKANNGKLITFVRTGNVKNNEIRRILNTEYKRLIAMYNGLL